MLPYDGKLKQASRQLRNDGTLAEKILWEKLNKKQLGFTFYRQKPVGEYIVDFNCPKVKLVIEVDGGYHNNKETKENDFVRELCIENLGLHILRFNNYEVLDNIGRVINRIKENINIADDE